MLKVNEIFTSIDGEINYFHQGRVTNFIRFSGCHLSCVWCDTDHSAFTEMTPSEVVKKLEKTGIKNVTITGGEPLLQKELRKVIFLLTEKRFSITVETSGTIKIPIDILFLANWIMDIKTPSSGCTKDLLNIEYYQQLPPNVFFKFPIKDMIDYETAKETAERLYPAVCAFSPIIGESKTWPRVLAEKMIEDKLRYIFNLQIHKYLNVK